MGGKKNTTKVGASTEARIVSELLRLGCNVFTAFGKDQGCADMVVGCNNVFWSVQCKTARIANGSIEISLHTVVDAGRDGMSYRSYVGDVDWIVAYCPENGEFYCLSGHDKTLPKSGLHLSLGEPTTKRYKRTHRMAADYKLEDVVAKLRDAFEIGEYEDDHIKVERVVGLEPTISRLADWRCSNSAIPAEHDDFDVSEYDTDEDESSESIEDADSGANAGALAEIRPNPAVSSDKLSFGSQIGNTNASTDPDVPNT